jgi:lysophospholipase L1-like esterase
LDHRYLVFVALGDSLTVGFQSPSRKNPYGVPTPYTHTLLNHAWSRVKEQGIENLTIVFENEGVNGDRTGGMLARFDARVKPHKPDWVILWAGLNDLSSGAKPENAAKNMETLVAKIKEINAKPIILTLAPTASGERFNEVIRSYNQILEELCIREKATCVDLYSELAGESGLLNPKYSNDGAHLNTEGYAQVAEIIYNKKVGEIIEGYNTE